MLMTRSCQSEPAKADQSARCQTRRAPRTRRCHKLLTGASANSSVCIGIFQSGSGNARILVYKAERTNRTSTFVFRLASIDEVEAGQFWMTGEGARQVALCLTKQMGF